MSAPPYVKTFRYLWLGQPATAANVVPGTGGLNVANLAPILLDAKIRTFSAAANVAVVALLKDSAWQFGMGANVQASITDDTTDAQDADATDTALETANAANTGFIIGGDQPPSAISFDISTNSAGSPVRIVEYWNGTGWTTIPAGGHCNALPANWGTGSAEVLLMFIPPTEWVRGGGADETANGVTGANMARYNLRVRCTTAPTTAGVAKRIYVGTVLDGQQALAANGTFSSIWANTQGWPCPSSFAAISGATSVANDGNVISVIYR